MPKYTHLNWHNENFYNDHPTRKKVRDSCLERVNWPALCAYASSLKDNRPCTLLDKSTSGGVHLIRLLEFREKETNTQWIARIQLEPSTPEIATALEAEIAAMELIRSRNEAGPRGGKPEILVVPQIYGYKLDDANPVDAAFILMQFLPGSSAMDAAGGYDVHRGRVPVEWRSALYREMARIQVWYASTITNELSVIYLRMLWL
jgi:hypothetical protein